MSSVSSGEGLLTLNATCKDLAGNEGTASYNVMVDKTAPSLSPSVSPNPVILGGTATASANATDGGSGIASESCGTLDTGSVGVKTVTCSATDLAGNTASAMTTYSVMYNFFGFFQPVDNAPTINQVTAGRAIPVKFSLSGYQGMNIFAPGYPTSQSVNCATGVTVDDIETTVTAGSSSLNYDATSGQYNYVWKTEKSWAGTCRQLNVKLADGSVRTALFKFK